MSESLCNEAEGMMGVQAAVAPALLSSKSSGRWESRLSILPMPTNNRCA